LCKLAQYAAKHHTAAGMKFLLAGKYRILTICNELTGQTIHIFGEALAVYPLLDGFRDNASKKALS
jgi:hypothetical protein